MPEHNNIAVLVPHTVQTWQARFSDVCSLAGGADTITVGMQVQFGLYSLTQA